MNIDDIRACIATASAELSSRKEEINRLNVFPVPDGDTGTNMSLTICLLYTSPSPRDPKTSRMPSSA